MAILIGSDSHEQQTSLLFNSAHPMLESPVSRIFNESKYNNSSSNIQHNASSNSGLERKRPERILTFALSNPQGFPKSAVESTNGISNAAPTMSAMPKSASSNSIFPIGLSQNNTNTPLGSTTPLLRPTLTTNPSVNTNFIDHTVPVLKRSSTDLSALWNLDRLSLNPSNSSLEKRYLFISKTQT